MKRIETVRKEEKRMKKSFLLMGLWAEEGDQTPKMLEEKLRSRLKEITNPGTLYSLKEKRGERWVHFVGAEVDRYDPLPEGMEVWYLSGYDSQEGKEGAGILTNLSTGEVLYEDKKDVQSEPLLRFLWKEAVKNAIFERRSVRSYLDQEVEEEKILQMLRAAMQAPSAKNQQPWEFIVLRDREKMLDLSSKLSTMRMLDHAPLCIALLANTEHLSSPTRWCQDLSAATQNLLLEAHHQGLGAVWLGVYPEEERMSIVREILGVEDPLVPFALVAIGYAKKYPEPVERYDEKKVRYL